MEQNNQWRQNSDIPGGYPLGGGQNAPRQGNPAYGAPDQHVPQQPPGQQQAPWYPPAQGAPPQPPGYPPGAYQQPPPQWPPQPPSQPPKNRKPLIIGLAVGMGVVILALLIVIILLLAQRGGTGSASHAAPPSGWAESGATGGESRPQGGGEPDMPGALDVGAGLTFRSTNISPGYAEFTSRLFLYPDGFYLFKQDILEGTRDEYGEYTIEGDILTITPTRTGVAGTVSGAPQPKQFTVMGQKVIIFNGAVGGDLDSDETFEQVEHVAPPLDDPRNMGTYVDEEGNEQDLLLSLGVDGYFYISAFNNPWENESGYARINGSYRQEGDVLVCEIKEIEKIDKDSFTGDDLTELTFRFTAPGVLEYTGKPIGDIQTGDVFELWDRIQTIGGA